ncbi:BCCT family transporter [Peptostreptococcus canis]|uniref:BCCT family transporter n=1 Tax=Peptostreptococcus canis TaxID=1159213 RepID=A0ABR6TM13_9FIRM|nr:BCCT family transporter [Peptostreptococcus canis]MBC2576026.1 BCCT family transporter [Peptostreptococcus canis]MBP1997850.1 glycine betaine transporter [Peptostreptococcus canis]
MEKRNNNTVYFVSVIISVIIAVWGIFGSESFGKLANSLMSWVTVNTGWLYLLAMLIFVIFALVIAFSKFGNIRLGPDDSKPEFKTLSWFGMLFGAGMGIGLVFYGIAEPISHYVAPIAGVAPATEEAARFAMRASFVHWGIHPWAGYSIIGLGLAYIQFRKNKPGLISSLFIPIIGEEKVNSGFGKVIDTFAVIATIAGVATSLGMGTMQINSGLSYLFKIPSNVTTWLIIIIIITVIYTWTAVSGIDKGINMISNLNLILAFSSMLIAVIVGPKVMMANSFVGAAGDYINQFFKESLNINPFGDNTWIQGWRIFYWAWWIAWAPFVGTFIARISKGRTVREFIFGVTLAPAMASLIWFSIFGSMGLNLREQLGIEKMTEMAGHPEIALFEVFAKYPLGIVLSMITIVLLCTFFITSANSATFVLSMFSQNGDLNPSKKKMLVWGILQAVIAYALMVSGGLKALQTASIAAAFPFIFIMLAICMSIVKALRNELKIKE